MTLERDNHTERAPAPTGPSAPYKYWAFISYSHRDAAWARRIHRAIEGASLPRALVGKQRPYGPIPPRLFPVFRDTDELPSSHDLPAALEAALRASTALVVLGSPDAAESRYVNAEVQYFAQLGRGHRVFYVIVGGDRSAPMDALLPSATNAASPNVPLAADVRPRADPEWIAVAKLVAGIVAVPLDEVVRRERRRRVARARRVVGTSGAVAALLTVAWLGAADSGLRLPLGDAVRTFADAHQISLLRAVPSDAAVRAEAARLRLELLAVLVSRHYVGDGFVANNPDGRQCFDPWSQNQALSGTLRVRDPDAVSAQHTLLDGLGATHRPQALREGCPMTPLSVLDTDYLVPVWWDVWTNALALRRPDIVDPEGRERAVRGLEELQPLLTREVAGGVEEGAWTIFPWQESRERASAYASVLALTALLELRAADYPWRGSREALDREAAATARWLLAQYDPEAEVPGWSEATDYNSTKPYDGLRLQVIGALLRAETEGLVEVPPGVRAQWGGFLEACLEREFDFPLNSAAVEGSVARPGQQAHMHREGFAFTWYPWAIQATSRWIERARQDASTPPEELTRMRRLLAHLVIDLGPAAAKLGAQEWTYQAAESLIGLAEVPVNEPPG